MHEKRLIEGVYDGDYTRSNPAIDRIKKLGKDVQKSAAIPAARNEPISKFSRCDLTRASFLSSSRTTSVTQIHTTLLPTVYRRCTACPRTRSTGLETRLRDRICNRSEDLIDIYAALRARLEEEQSFLLGIVPRLLRPDLPPLARRSITQTLISCLRSIRSGRLLNLPFLSTHKIALIPHEPNHNPGTSLPLQLRDPVLRLRKTALLGEIIHDQRSLRITVVHWRQTRKALLASRIPYLEFDRPRGQGEFLGQERRADCGLFGRVEFGGDEA